MKQIADFEDIRPYCNDEYHDKISTLLKEPQFKSVISTVMPEIPFEALSQKLLSINTIRQFQAEVIALFVEKIIGQTTTGVSCEGLDNIDSNGKYLFMSNHRDIVLDASFLCYLLLKNGMDTCEIAIGNNLLVYQWISDLVRINKSFIVKRGVGVRQALEAANQLSSYIHYAINQKGESVWIAQREGRSKDSNDRTQEALIKMLSLGYDGNLLDSIKSLNIAPVAISYEYDPCDSLKAYELLQRSKNPEFKKTQQDDLVSMQTGIMGYKGKVIYQLTPCINNELDGLDANADKTTILQSITQIIDKHIHLNYHIYPGNYVAYDKLYNTNRFASMYSVEKKEKFEKYIAQQIARLGELSEDDYKYVHETMLLMYSNPLKNQLAASE